MCSYTEFEGIPPGPELIEFNAVRIESIQVSYFPPSDEKYVRKQLAADDGHHAFVRSPSSIPQTQFGDALNNPTKPFDHPPMNGCKGSA